MKNFAKRNQRQLLYLLAVTASGTVIAVSGTGDAAFGPITAFVAVVVAAAIVVSLPHLRRWVVGSAGATASTSSPALNRTKKILILVMAAGAIAYVGGRGTFAIFTAETDNSANSMSSGTLVLGNSVNGGTTCWSYSGSNKDNVNTGCTPLLSPSNMAPGLSSAQTTLAIKNGGSLDASTFQLMAPWPRAALSAGLTKGTAPASLSLTSGLTVALSSGNSVTVTSAGYSQTFSVGIAGAAIGATSIPLAAGTLAANYDYPVGSRVENISGNTVPTNTDCYDTATTNATVPVAGATPGNAMTNFVIPSNNALCQAALFWVQEQTNGVNYCWVGNGAVGSAAVSTIGQCRTPTTARLSTGVTSGTPVSTLNVSALTGNIKPGDTLTITEGTNQQTFTTDSTTGAAYINGTTVALTGWTPNYSYTTAAVIKDTSAFDALNGDFQDTISNFDTFDRPSAPVTLYPLTSNTTAPNGTATVSLGKTGSSGNAGDTRTFYIGVYLPAWSSKPQNQLQGLISTFGINWYIQQ